MYVCVSPYNCIPTSDGIPIVPKHRYIVYLMYACMHESVIRELNCIVYVCIGVEMFKKTMDFGQAGDNVGILLRGGYKCMYCMYCCWNS
jgi:hypothetical protein